MSRRVSFDSRRRHHIPKGLHNIGKDEFVVLSMFGEPSKCSGALQLGSASLRTIGKISQGKAPQSLSYFHGALNWQTWQTGLFVFSVQ
jgi:hypothetical protein